MNDLTKYQDQIVEAKVVKSDISSEPANASISDIVAGILRRWYVVLLIFLVISGAGIPAIWLLMKPSKEVTGAIRVAPILMNLLSGQEEKGGISNYQNFMNTQAIMITSNQVVQRVADNLVEKNLNFFKDNSNGFFKKIKKSINRSNAKPELSTILKQAITDGIIISKSDKKSELIKISMINESAREAKQVVNAFISAYMAVEVSSFTETENQKLRLLENERKVLSEKIHEQRKIITELANEYGDKNLESRHDMKMKRVSSLLAKVTEYEARRIYLEATVELLEKTKDEQTLGTQELLQLRNEYTTADPVIIEFAKNITSLEQELIFARQKLSENNPELAKKIELVETMKEHVERLKNEAGNTFDKLVVEKNTNAAKNKLANIKTELEQIQTYEQKFRELLEKEDNETITVGRTHIEIEDLEDELELSRETYISISRRIRDLEMQLKRPARISVAYSADISANSDRRPKLSLAVIFGAMGCGMGTAFLLTKADKSLRTPNDIIKIIDCKVLGSISNSRNIKKSLLDQHLTQDYQIIRENLGMIGDDVDEIPKKLIITSPGSAEGKTTFAINLASCIAKTGKKVLLIDGDLRSPDIAHLLDLPEGSYSLQKLILNDVSEFGKCVYHMPSNMFDVLTADFRNTSQAFELLVDLHKSGHIDKLSKHYDHIIIDTPPALAFPDAIIWGKIAGAAIIASFAGQTTAADLYETRERLIETKVNVLGTVLGNAPTNHNYYRHSRAYYSHLNREKKYRKSKNSTDRTMILPLRKERTRKKPPT